MKVFNEAIQVAGEKMSTSRLRPGDAWPTVLMLVGCYAGWILGTTWLFAVSPLGAIIVTGIAIALHASLQHEAIHGHPFQRQWMNDAMVVPAFTLVIPYARFRATHLDHHQDADLTDPYDDPESNYLDPARWETLPAAVRAVLLFNNTLLGRVTVGPVVGTIGFVMNEIRAARAGDRRVLRGWLLHLGPLALVLAWVSVARMPLWAYLIAAYIGLGLLKIRTFLEHRAHEASRARSVIIEDRGPLAYLFLNNNYHVVHHLRPDVPWHRLPKVYRANRDRFLEVNDGYLFRSYGEVIGRFLFTRKDPVAHPLMPNPDGSTPLVRQDQVAAE
ncbi:MAG: fatty acid desaturase [Pseudomonadota bacterium]